MRNAPELGVLKTFVIDAGRNWLVTATSRGFYTCWDLRFSIPVKTWRHSDHSKRNIHRLAPSPATNKLALFALSSPFFFAANGDNQIDTWDIESTAAKQVFKIVPEFGGHNGHQAPLPGSATLHRPQTLDFGTEDLQRQVTNSESSMRAVMPGPSDAMSGAPNYILSAGTDRCIRYWDLNNVSKSFVISGPYSSHSSPSPSQLPVYSAQTVGQTTYFFETPPPTLLSSLASHTTSPSTSLSSSSSSSSMSTSSSSSSSSSSGGAGGAQAAESTRFTMGSGKQRPPPIHHNDAIVDLEVLELPTRLLISGSRDGVIKVWK